MMIENEIDQEQNIDLKMIFNRMNCDLVSKDKDYEKMDPIALYYLFNLQHKIKEVVYGLQGYSDCSVEVEVPDIVMKKIKKIVKF